MKRNLGLASTILAIGIIAAASAVVAQTTTDPHHPDAAPQTKQTPGRGMMCARGAESGLPWIGVFSKLTDPVSKIRHSFAVGHGGKTLAEQGQQS